MLIERQYVRFIDLIRTDEKSKGIFMSAFNKSYAHETEERKEEIFESLTKQCLYQRVMSWCFNGLGEVIDGFEGLDKSDPYDNGFDFSDVKEVDIVEKNEESVKLHLLNICDGVERIVAVREIR